MKSKIFIAIHYLELGGAETSLIGLLHAFDPEKVDVDLFVYSHQGELMKAIPPYVHLLPKNGTWSMFEKPLLDVLKAGQLRMFLARMKAKRQMKEYVKRMHPSDGSAIFGFLGKEVSKVLPDINPDVEYDLAISYLHPHDFVLDHVRAKKKLCWVHTDYSTIDVNTELELPIWGAYDHIVSISPDCTKAFVQKFPSLKDKIMEMENILPVGLIKERANESLIDTNYHKLSTNTSTQLSTGLSINSSFENTDEEQKGKFFNSQILDKKEIILLSVGRICEAKNYDNIPYMAKALKELFEMRGERLEVRDNSSKNYTNHSSLTTNQKSFHWYIVGPGNHDEIDELSKQLGVDDVVTFLGPSSNPYPYIKACDIYVHPSRYEGKSIVVREAQILCKPVIITNYPTAKSQINDGVDGIICELDNQKIAEAIYQLANDNKMQNEIIAYLQNHDFAGLAEVNKIYQLLDLNGQEFKN